MQYCRAKISNYTDRNLIPQLQNFSTAQLAHLWVGFHQRAGQYKWQICSWDQWPGCVWQLWAAPCEGGPPPEDSSSAERSYPEPCCGHKSSPEGDREKKKQMFNRICTLEIFCSSLNSVLQMGHNYRSSSENSAQYNYMYAQAVHMAQFFGG